MAAQVNYGHETPAIQTLRQLVMVAMQNVAVVPVKLAPEYEALRMKRHPGFRLRPVFGPKGDLFLLETLQIEAEDLFGAEVSPKDTPLDGRVHGAIFAVAGVEERPAELGGFFVNMPPEIRGAPLLPVLVHVLVELEDVFFARQPHELL